jgi:hypothetical protein
MPLVLANRVQESATANTTVSFTLTGAIAGFQTFSVIGDTNTTYYSATDGSGNWEVGLGTYSTTGPTLTRTTVYASSNSGNAVTFSGAVNVFVTYPSGRSVNLDGSGNVSALGTVASGTWQGSTIAVAYGGTGVTSSSGANSVVLRDSNANVTVNRVNQANTSTTAAGGTTALTAASSYIQTLVGTGGQTYALPDATTLTTGVAFVFNNLATGTLTITDYATATIGTIPSGGAGAVFLTANGTTGGTWDLHAYLPEGVTFGTNAFNLGSAVISGGTWQGGTIQSGYGGTGLTTFTGANNALYSTGASTLTAGTLPVAAGGTGATTAGAALTSLGAVNKAGDTMTGALAIDISTSSAALRVTQTGSGNALVVEDSTNPDSTPFVINADGNVLIGTTSPRTFDSSTSTVVPVLQTEGTAANTSSASLMRNTAANTGPILFLGKSRSGSLGGATIVQDGDQLGQIIFEGTDGASLVEGALIRAEVDGTPGTSDMPGRLVFSTTADGASSPTERMRITSAGFVGIGKTPSTTLDVNGTIAATTLTPTNALGVAYGGTGQTTYTNGELLIGNTTGNTLTKATLTGTANQITVTNGGGSITLSTPQSINTAASVQFGSFGVGTAASGTTGEIRATNNVTAYFSDDRLKNKLGRIENALDKLCGLEGFYYEPNETAQSLGYEVKREVGVSAQAVQAVMPEIVAPAPIDDKYLTVRYDRALPLVIEAIKELRAEVAEIKEAMLK